jgi:hypothetical protein
MAERSLDADIRQNDKLVETDAKGVTRGIAISAISTWAALVIALLLALLKVPYWWAFLSVPALNFAPRVIGAIRGSADDDSAKP